MTQTELIQSLADTYRSMPPGSWGQTQQAYRQLTDALHSGWSATPPWPNQRPMYLLPSGARTVDAQRAVDAWTSR